MHLCGKKLHDLDALNGQTKTGKCRACRLLVMKRYRLRYKNRLNAKARLYRSQNRAEVNRQAREHYAKHPERNRARVARKRATPERAEKVRNSARKYARSHKRRAAEARRRRCDSVRLAHNLRTRTGLALRGRIKSGATLQLLGCSIEHFRAHLESLWAPGMSWSNYGRTGWHLDHIRPCASFDLADPQQQNICFHYTNVQPLWAAENVRKSASYK